MLKINQRLSNNENATLDDSEDSNLSNSAPLYSLQAKLIRLRKHSMQSSLYSHGAQRALVVDGATLVHALDPNLKKLFLKVAEKFKSVLCCRSTPLQKVQWLVAMAEILMTLIIAGKCG